MNHNLREYIQQNDKEQKKCLGMYKLAVKIRRFGLTGFYITDPEPSIFIDDDETADGWKKIKFLFHLLAFTAGFFATENFTLVLIVYIAIHAAFVAVGQYLHERYRKKLEGIGYECQNLLNSFFQEQYQENGIIRGANSDVLCFDHNFILTSGFFEADLHNNCQPMVINARDCICVPDGTEDYINMRHNIASVEFNKKFKVYVPEGRKADCMKFLTPTRQVAMIRSAAFDEMDSMYLNQGKMHVETDFIFQRPDEIVNPFSFASMLTLFENAEIYCREVREGAERFYDAYLKITEMIGA